MKNQNKSKSLVTKVLGGALFAGLFILNVMVFVQSDNDGASLSLSTLKAYALSGSLADGSGSGSGSGDSCNGCPAGQACVEGVCVVKEKATRTSCTKSFFCWSSMKSKSATGHETKCPTSPTGSTDCAVIECDAQDPC